MQVVYGHNIIIKSSNFTAVNIGGVTLTPSGSEITGETGFTLTCSAQITPNPLPEHVPPPTYEWFFGSSNDSLPSGVTVSNHSVTNSSSIYSSTLQFSFLQEHHSGLYTCRLGGNERLAVNSNISVNGIYTIQLNQCTPMICLLLMYFLKPSL